MKLRVRSFFGPLILEGDIVLKFFFIVAIFFFNLCNCAADQSDKKRVLLRKKKDVPSNQKIRLRVKSSVPQSGQGEVKKAGFAFFSSYPEFGDMDVVGKQLLDGLTVSLGSLSKNDDQSVKLVSIGNNSLLGDAGILALKKFQQQSNVVFGGIGSSFLLKFISEPWARNLVYLFPIENNSYIREKVPANTIFYRPTYEQELKVLADYVFKEKRKLRVGILYESGFEGSFLYNSFLDVLKKYSIQPAVAARYPQGTVEINRALQNIVAASPNVIFCLAKPRPAYKFIKQAVDLGLHAVMFVGLSPLISIQQLLKKARGIDVVTLSVLPHWESMSVELVQKYNKAIGKRFGAKRNEAFALEAFFYLKLIDFAVKRRLEAVKNPDIIVQELRAIKDTSFMGIPLNFNSRTLSLASKIWLAPSDNHESWLERNLE